MIGRDPPSQTDLSRDAAVGTIRLHTADEQFGTVIKTFDEIGTVVSDAADGVKKHTQHVERLSQLLMGVALALAICASLFVAVLSARGTARNLRGASEVAGRLADGDLGDSPEEQEILLGALVDSGLPVLAVAGNREVRTDLDAVDNDDCCRD